MRRRRWRGHLSAADQAELWRRWRQGEPVNARALDRRRSVFGASWPGPVASPRSCDGAGANAAHARDGSVLSAFADKALHRAYLPNTPVVSVTSFHVFFLRVTVHVVVVTIGGVSAVEITTGPLKRACSPSGGGGLTTSAI